ncbi:NADPH-dependent FMN reductase [Lentilactobacillus laojiaonis]|uniref:NADPH-dependent FMN reductase n=1 Tax=Lentilactobacillus laojiaonis TaxID=2883998 RepID=UPI001D0A1F54|nr:NAD(P)H-dependent oxidoreductase [Lentilactobacillus laojiaonis]UDM32249.1 NAD(P)H-dependent oxidoreductase [Lentilactobacillus laojiaonis]
MSVNVAVIAGSLRQGAFSKAIAKSVASLLPEDYIVKFININMDLYNQDLDQEETVPESWKRFRQDMSKMDAVIFVTPEYNRSIPGGLKNALDVGSRPMGSSIWDKKPALIISESPGGMGGMAANFALRQSLVFLNMPTVQQPEAYLGKVTSFINEDGSITDQRELDYFQSLVNAFVDLVKKNVK